MKNSALSFGWVLVAALILTASVAGQQSDITVMARLVIVDVNVSDKNGQAVHGLTCADFKLEESHIPQALQRCGESVFGVRGGNVAPPKELPINVFSNEVAAPLPATIDVVLIDLLNGEPETRGVLTQAARDLIRATAPGHRMAVFVLGQRLTLLSGFSEDLRRLESSQAKVPASVVNPYAIGQSEALSAEVSQGNSNPKALAKATSASAASEVLSSALAGRLLEDRIETTLNALREIDRYVAGLPGRKKLLWITSSFPNLFQPHGDNGASTGPSAPPFSDMLNFQPQIEEVSRELARDRIALFPIDVRGVRNLSLVDASQDSIGIRSQPDLIRNHNAVARSSEINERGTMDTLAAETGGHAFYGDNDVNRMVRKALDVGNDFYTLSYRPSDSTDDGRFRSFRITTTAVGTKLFYRRGYVAPLRAVAGVPVAAMMDQNDGGYLMKRGLPFSASILFMPAFTRMARRILSVKATGRARV